jgi:hypothetical protein
LADFFAVVSTRRLRDRSIEFAISADESRSRVCVDPVDLPWQCFCGASFVGELFLFNLFFFSCEQLLDGE